MAKKKKLTLLEKQTDAYLHELCLHFLIPALYKPDYWAQLSLDNYLYYLSVIAALGEAKDAGSITEEEAVEGVRLAARTTVLKDYWREVLRDVIDEACSLEEDPFHALEEKLNLPLEMQVDFIALLFTGFPSKILPVALDLKSNGELTFKVDLRFTDNTIMKAIDRHLEYYLSPLGQRVLDSKGRRPKLEDGRVVEVIRNPGKGPYGPDLESPMLIVSIDFNAGKTKIRKALDELLKKLSPRDTVPTPKFYPDVWEKGYEVLDLHLQGLSPEQIAARLGKSYGTAYGQFRDIHKHVYRKEWGTKRKRRQESGELQPSIVPCWSEERRQIEKCPYRVNGIPQCDRKKSLCPEAKDFVNQQSDDKHNGWGAWLQYKGMSTVEKAEREMASSGLVGGSGCHRKASHIFGRDDEAGTFFLGEDESWFTPPDWHTDCFDCKLVPGSEGCSTCSQEYPSAYYVDGLLENKDPYKPSAYTRRFIFPPTHPGTGKIKKRQFEPDDVPGYEGVGHKKYLAYWDSRHHRILEQIAFTLGYHYIYDVWSISDGQEPSRDEELALQAEYIASNSVTECPLKVAKAYGPRWGWKIAHGPMPERPSKRKFDDRKWAHLVGQFSQTFTMRLDLLEDLLIGLIDSRKIYTLFQKSIYRKGGFEFS